MTEKRCKACLTIKSVSEFYRNSKTRDGLLSACIECVRRANQARYEANPRPAKDRAAQWAKANPDRRREIVAASAAARTAQRAEAHARRRAAMTIEERRAADFAANHARRVRKAGGANVLTPDEVRHCIDRGNGRCIYCGMAAPLTIDHFYPVSKGGDNAVRNLVPCCKSCNSSKHNRTPEDWLEQRRGTLALARTLLFLEGRDIPAALYEEEL